MPAERAAARRLGTAIARWREAIRHGPPSASAPSALCGWPAAAAEGSAGARAAGFSALARGGDDGAPAVARAAPRAADGAAAADRPATPPPRLPTAAGRRARPLRLFVCAPDEAADAAGAALVRALRARHRPGVDICGLVRRRRQEDERGPPGDRNQTDAPAPLVPAKGDARCCLFAAAPVSTRCRSRLHPLRSPENSANPTQTPKITKHTNRAAPCSATWASSTPSTPPAAPRAARTPPRTRARPAPRPPLPPPPPPAPGSSFSSAPPGTPSGSRACHCCPRRRWAPPTGRPPRARRPWRARWPCSRRRR